MSEQDEFTRDLRAWRAVLPASAAFTHVTAARLLGWHLPVLPTPAPVFAAVQGDVSRPQRAGLVYSRLVRPASTTYVGGIPVDASEEILLRASRDLGLLDMVVLMDSARRAGHLDPDRMRDILESRRPGVRMLAMSWSWSDPRAESAGETLLRLFHVAMDVPVEPQAMLTDDHGRVLGRADLLICGTQQVQEYDGAVHRVPHQQRVDLRRERGLAAASYQRRGYTLDDLLNHPLVVMHELDRLLGRSHRRARIRRWQRLVENSLYGASGRQRVLNRWRRADSLVDWSRTA